MSAANVDSVFKTENVSQSVETNPSADSPRRPIIKTKEKFRVEQHELGGVVLEAIDHLTGMSADEIEVLADRLMDGARETEDVLRELARRVREYGLIASEKLANFVRVANNCAEVARSMGAHLEKRDEAPVAQPGAAAQADAPDQQAGAAQPATEQLSVDLNTLGEGLNVIGADLTPPTQPSEGTEIVVPQSGPTGDRALVNRPSRRKTFGR